MTDSLALRNPAHANDFVTANSIRTFHKQQNIGVKMAIDANHAPVINTSQLLTGITRQHIFRQ